MSRAEQVRWWIEQVAAARRTGDVVRTERRAVQGGGILADQPQARGGWTSPASSSAPAAHILLQGVTITGGRDEEKFRRLDEPSGRGGGTGSDDGWSTRKDRASGDEFGASRSASDGDSAGLGRARLLAAGYQPAVIKVVSYARGAARATATGQYIQREDVLLETHDGRMLVDREAVAAEIRDWSKDFAKRAESQDVAAIRLKLHGVHDTPDGRELIQTAIAAGFVGHRYAVRINALPSGQIEARLVVALAGAERERFRVKEERIGTEEAGFNRRVLDAKSEAAIKARIEAATGYPQHAMSVEPSAPSHGRDGVTYQLNKLIAPGQAIDDQGRGIAHAADARNAAREWGPSLRSQSSRDTMHLIISAKAGTDVAALNNAARAFLHDRFADHKFMFGVHTDKEAEGHIHAHAVITVRNESGQKIHPGRDDFRTWREAYAQHAHAQGLKIVATSAMERASSQSYGPKDNAIVAAADRPRPGREARDRAYASDPANQRLITNARQRIARARANPIKLPLTREDRAVLKESGAAWRAVAAETSGCQTAQRMHHRLGLAQAVGGVLHAIGKRVQISAKEEGAGMAITSDQMAKDLRAMNEAVSRTADLLDGTTKQQFNERAASYLETLANRVDLQRAREKGVEQLTRAEVEAIVGVKADRLIERAQENRAKEQREAVDAQRLADRAVEVERRGEARGGIDPTSQRELKEKRAIASSSEQVAARETREAADAAEAARVLAEYPARPLPPTSASNAPLAKLRVEQERVLQEIEAERVKSQTIKGQRMK